MYFPAKINLTVKYTLCTEIIHSKFSGTCNRTAERNFFRPVTGKKRSVYIEVCMEPALHLFVGAHQSEAFPVFALGQIDGWQSQTHPCRNMQCFTVWREVVYNADVRYLAPIIIIVRRQFIQ